MNNADIPQNDSQKLNHPTLHRVPTPNRKPPSQRMRFSNPITPLRENTEEQPSKFSAELALEQNFVSIYNSQNPDHTYVEPVDKQIVTEVPETSEGTKISLPTNLTLINRPDPTLQTDMKDPPGIAESRSSSIIKTDKEDQIDINTPMLMNETTEKDTRNEKTPYRSLSSVLSDYFFIIIGICFFIENVEVIIQAIPLVIILFASLIMFQIWMKNFKI